MDPYEGKKNWMGEKITLYFHYTLMKFSFSFNNECKQHIYLWFLDSRNVF